MIDVKTYPEMNAQIVSLLRIDDENPVCLYAAKRIVELEAALNKTNAKKTNGDKIRSMTDEDLARMLCMRQSHRFTGCPTDTSTCEDSQNDCKKCWLKWMKEEADGKM